MADELKQKAWEQALQEAFQEHYKFLYRAAFNVISKKQDRLRRQQDAEDTVQNVFLRLVEAAVDPEIRMSLKAYLYQAVVNEALNLNRSGERRREDRNAEVSEIAMPGTERADENVRNKLEESFAALSDEVQEIVMLHSQDGYSDREIGEMLGYTRSKVAMTLSRSRARMKQSGVQSKEKYDAT